MIASPQKTAILDHPQFGDGNRTTISYVRFDFIGNYSATSNNMQLVHLPLMGYIWYSKGTGRGRSPPRPLLHCTKCNSPPINGQCTNHRIAV